MYIVAGVSRKEREERGRVCRGWSVGRREGVYVAGGVSRKEMEERGRVCRGRRGRREGVFPPSPQKEREERGRVCVALLHQTSLHSEKLLQHFFIKSMQVHMGEGGEEGEEGRVYVAEKGECMSRKKGAQENDEGSVCRWRSVAE